MTLQFRILERCLYYMKTRYPPNDLLDMVFVELTAKNLTKDIMDVLSELGVKDDE